MILHSTRHIAPDVDLAAAVKRGLPPDNGLYMPNQIRTLNADFLKSISDHSFNDMAFAILANQLDGYINDRDLRSIIDAAFNFDAPIHWLEENVGILELFQGPTLAFKDFGARFMGRLLEYFLKDENNIVDILVATSGDTGSAVAHGFLDTHGIRVTILYPKGKVSDIQERQFATLGKNIRVLEVDGTFDDCQRMVKTAFLDNDLNNSLTLSSANSINIARLLPQSLYYFWAYAQLANKDLPLIFSIPSGNFGNLTAGLFAKKMGLPIDKLIASNNANDIFTNYWHSGFYEPKPSVQTLSNAMDVGDPSNFQRILSLYQDDWKSIKADISAFTFSDDETRFAIHEVFKQYQYTMCPHTAIGYLGLQVYRSKMNRQANYIGLATAHPVKFQDTVEAAIGHSVPIPERLKAVMGKQKLSHSIPVEYTIFKDFLMQKK